MRSLLERFEEKFTRTPAPGCWIWTAAKNPLGYGNFVVKSRKEWVNAHRMAWKLYRGEIPEGLELDHKCRNPSCVNPDHLEPVTHRENLLRGVGPIPTKAAQTHCFRGHELSADNLLKNKRGFRLCRACNLINTRAAYAQRRGTPEEIHRNRSAASFAREAARRAKRLASA